MAIVIIRLVTIPMASRAGVGVGTASVLVEVICLDWSEMSVVSSRSSAGHKGRKITEIDLDVKRSIVPSDLVVSPPAPPLASVAPSDAAAVCALTKRVTVSIKAARVLKVAQGRRNVSAVTLRVSKNALNNLMDIDDALLVQARQDTDQWFGSSRVSNVDEFFRSSTATDRAAGIVARLSLDVSRSSRAGGPAFSATQGEDIDVVLSLVGIRFLRQHVDVLWRFVSSKPSGGCFTREVHSLPVSDDDDHEDVSIHGPTPEERETMFTELFGRLDCERRIIDNRLRELDALTDILEDGHDTSDISVLESVSDKLDAILRGTPAPSCRQDISCCS